MSFYMQRCDYALPRLHSSESADELAAVKDQQANESTTKQRFNRPPDPDCKDEDDQRGNN